MIGCQASMHGGSRTQQWWLYLRRLPGCRTSHQLAHPLLFSSTPPWSGASRKLRSNPSKSFTTVSKIFDMAAITIAPSTPEFNVFAKLGQFTFQKDTFVTPPDSPLSSVELSLSSFPDSISEEFEYQHQDPHYLPESRSSEYSKPIFYLPPLVSLPMHALRILEPMGSFQPYKVYEPDFAAATLALHRALHHFQPVTEDAAETPFEEAFNWDELHLPESAEREWYATVTYSKARDGSSSDALYESDRQAHDEAVLKGGLILFWDSAPHTVTGVRTTVCIWRSRAHAIAAHSGPHHIRALRRVLKTHERYDTRRYRLRKVRGESMLHVESYDNGDEDW